MALTRRALLQQIGAGATAAVALLHVTTATPTPPLPSVPDVPADAPPVPVDVCLVDRAGKVLGTARIEGRWKDDVLLPPTPFQPLTLTEAGEAVVVEVRVVGTPFVGRSPVPRTFVVPGGWQTVTVQWADCLARAY